MEPDISALFKSISLTDSESPPVIFPVGIGTTHEADSGFYMVGKVLHPRPVNPETVAKQMRRAFNPLKEMKVKFLGDNKFLFRFQLQGDYLRVEEGTPWHFENHLLVLSRVPPGGYADSVALDTCPFTVQIHNLPFLSFPTGVAEALGNRIGTFIHAEVDAQGESQVAALRLRVAVDVRKPLVRALQAPTPEGSLVTVAITYEKLPIFCSECGKLDHQYRYCTIARERAAAPPTNPTYGPWLRAATARVLEPTASKKSSPSKSDTHTSSSEPAQNETGMAAPSYPEALHASRDEQEDLPQHEAQTAVGPDTDQGMMVLDFPILAPTLDNTLAQDAPEEMEGVISSRKRTLSSDPTIADEEEYPKAPPSAMSLLAWNCRGLRSASTVRRLRDVISSDAPSMIFLSETKCLASHVEWLKECLSYFGVAVSATGLSGGLALFWRKDVCVSLLSFCSSYIDVLVRLTPTLPEWRFTGFYGNPAVQLRPRSWDLLRQIRHHSICPWLVAGDFNEVVMQNEVESLNSRPASQMRAFRDALLDCQLQDIGFTGFPFTWCNKRKAPDTVRARLDRAVATTTWNNLFPRAIVKHLPYGSSDHLPLLIFLDPAAPTSIRPNKRRFKFEAFWTTIPGCADVIHQSWAPNSQPTNFNYRIQKTRMSLLKWYQSKVGPIKSRLQKIATELDLLARQSITDDIKHCESALKEEQASLWKQEEMYWKQRGKIHWLRCGDRNTAFFHASASEKRTQNRIAGIKNAHGLWITRGPEVITTMLSYYQDLFTSSPPDPIEMERALSIIPRTITDDMRAILERPYNAAEVWPAVRRMKPLSSPGPDGFPPVFYQKYWPTVGQATVEAVLKLLNNGVMEPQLNHSHIVLIPKKSNPQEPAHYRPISLSNVAYKIASKMVANRLKPIMERIVSKEQAAFLSGRSITDNILLAYELNHSIKLARRQSKRYGALKLDVSKAFDRLEWPFLEQVLRRHGFPASTTDTIMRLVSSATYSILINGSPEGHIVPTRGIRQGDPMSPYLFILCSDTLSRLLHEEGAHNPDLGIQLSPTVPKISHLLFADDTLIFSAATLTAMEGIRSVLTRYAAISGQLINLEKSALSVPSEADPHYRQLLSTAVGVPLTDSLGKYLGLPSMIGISKKAAFRSLKDRIQGRILHWHTKFLSKAGKMVLIKSVLQSIPSYTMQCFKIPTTLIRELNSLFSQFWWSDRGHSKMHLLAWDKLCEAPVQGGLGFRNLTTFNQALLAKQCWRIFTKDDLLLSRVLQGKYYKNTSFLEARLGRNPSFTWRSLLTAKNLLLSGLRWRPGDGVHINVWNSPWLPRAGSFKPMFRNPALSPHLRVSDLISPDTCDWNRSYIQQVFLPADAATILSIPLGSSGHHDRMIWHYSREGTYTVKSGYLHARSIESNRNPGPAHSNPEISAFWKHLWKVALPPKIILFGWRLCKGILPTKDLLFHRKICPDSLCEICHQHEET
ncbi:hypothetical protein M569_11401 [Genlisea aurea]|uniref:Reverse transcriptase domain-containing protein n=1 Tax=Genlisea aurea TaxID=192259 RepID=S8DKM9_9LAMI|nr:hypothetical protein M569_11401 [Genlisea aurea]